MSGLQDQVIPIHFGKGLDRKTDPKLVVAGKMLQLQDAVFTSAEQCDKRNGYTAISTAVGLGNLVAPKMIQTLNGELVCQDSGSLYGYSALLQAWLNKGYYVSVGVGLNEVAADSNAQALQTSVIWNNFAIYNWVEIGNGGGIGLTAIKDLTSASFVAGPVNPSPNPPVGYAGVQKSIVVGGSPTVPGSVAPDGSGNLVLTTFSITSLGVSLLGPFILYSAATVPVSFALYSSSFAAAALAAATAANTAAAAAAADAASASTAAASAAASAQSAYNSALSTYNANPTTANFIALANAGATLAAANATAAAAAETAATAAANATAAAAALVAAQATEGGIKVMLYDVAGTTGGGVVAFGTGLTGNAGTLKVVTFDDLGNITHTFSLAQTHPIQGVSISVGTNGNIWVYYTDYQNNLKYLILSSTLTSVLTSTQIAGGGSNLIFQLSSIPNSTTQQQFFYSFGNGVTPDSTDIYGGTVTSTGTVTPFVNNPLVRNLDIYTRPFKYQGSTYIGAIYRSSSGNVPVNSNQGTIFIIAVDGSFPGAVVAKCLSGSAYGTTPPPGWIAPSLSLSASQTGFLVPQVVTTDIIGGVQFQLSKSSVATFDFAASDAYQSLPANDVLIMNGGILWEYDGLSVTELGFNLYPEVVNFSSATTGGFLLAGKYSWAFVLQWTDMQGNFHQSTPYFYSTDYTGGTATNLASFVIRNPGVSMKQGVVLAVFRTQENGSAYTLVSSSSVATRGFSSIFFTDGATDASIASDDDLYTNGGVLDNDPPPPALSLVEHNNRIWAIDSENRNTLWYCKSLEPGVGISFSDNMTAQIDSVGGNCVALAHMDSNLVIFEERQPLVMSGDGVNDTGFGSTLSNPQPIPSDTSASQSRGLIVFPKGVLFKSPKGLYLLDRSLTVSYLGMPVEAYNAQTVTDATMIANTSQIRFLTSSGLSLVYDYIFDQWGTFTNHQGVGATIWNLKYVYARTDATIYQETQGYYLDNLTPFAPLAQTANLALSSVQNFQRVKRFGMTGNFANGASSNHGIQVSAAYDFSSSFSTPIPFLFGASNSSGPYQYRERLPQQKCDTISLLIQEISTGDPLESVTFTDMSFDAGMKKGIRKMPTNASVA